ncbi:unnamed protein product [Spirodela intermedia]|uniref:Uncharacterized protein n=1 Tax=Spirodela intermedia TaxID=51605 RepID=A0A7I8JP86_SPIIN|nr:unnamed protein product [Spirodela intermedia]CAA6671969.1 unnamed protein product [Spirodela intermedia]
MPAGIMVPARQAPPLMGYGSTSGLSLGQPSLLDATQHFQQQMDLTATTAESDMARIREDEFLSKSGSENADGASGDDLDPNQRPKKKRYHRHTQHQIQEMEAFFKECPHPDDKQRKELSRELGLEPLQVKFWFQNKRTQMKNQHERQENQQLRSENDKLRAENMRYKEALSNASCPNCGGPTAIGEMSFDEQQLRIENVRLREEIDRISGIAAKYVGKPVGSYPLMTPQVAPRSSLDLAAGNLGLPPAMAGHGAFGASEMLRSASLPNEFPVDKPAVVELAVAAMEELTRMAHAGEPLWMPSLEARPRGPQRRRVFPDLPQGHRSPPRRLQDRGLPPQRHRHHENVNLVEIIMDVNQWSMIFSSIVSRAATLEVLSTGVAGNYNGALQVMTAEFQMPSPLVPTRESYFLRYCKQHGDGVLSPTPGLRCRRRASGCLIQETPTVTWIEHVEVDDRTVHSMYRPLVNSGMAFGAKRWVSTLDASVSASPASWPPTDNVAGGRKSMLKLAERMVVSFCSGVSASAAHQWTTLSGACAEDVRVMTKKSVNEPGRPPGIVLSAATSFWLPWDILSNGGIVQEMAHIANGRDEGNCVSLLRVNSTNSNQSNMLILQESCTDAAGSYVIYAPVDLVAMNVDAAGHGGTGGALLTVAFQILVDSQPNAKLSLGSVATVNSLISCTVDRIKGNVLGEGAQ